MSLAIISYNGCFITAVVQDMMVRSTNRMVSLHDVDQFCARDGRRLFRCYGRVHPSRPHACPVQAYNAVSQNVSQVRGTQVVGVGQPEPSQLTRDTSSVKSQHLIRARHTLTRPLQLCKLLSAQWPTASLIHHMHDELLLHIQVPNQLETCQGLGAIGKTATGTSRVLVTPTPRLESFCCCGLERDIQVVALSETIYINTHTLSISTHQGASQYAAKSTGVKGWSPAVAIRRIRHDAITAYYSINYSCVVTVNVGLLLDDHC